MLDFASIEDAFPNDDKKKKIIKKVVNNDCKPLQAPNYEVPLCDNKDILNKVLDTSLNPPINKNDFNKDGIKSYDFDEYDAYLSISDIKTNNQDNSKEYRTTPFLAEYLKNLKMNFDKEIKDASDKPSNIEQFTNMNMINTTIKIDVNLYNLLLFIFLGIIIIILIHQITILVKE
jgi:hypothetical protein